LSEDTCPSNAPFIVHDTFNIVQRGAQFTATASSIPGLVLTGTYNDLGGYTVVGDGTEQGCATRLVLATGSGGNVALLSTPAGVGLAVNSSGVGCELIYLGSLTRE
jgi:hypothetical protein